jgi:UDP-hydrolysing UDP-N-acetyl-D-glucosamine 2-epimerase
MGIPILHSGGGALTLGAVDNIYRYNITNLSYVHFATSVGNYNRLRSLPNINQENIYFVGSVAIDNIIDFKENPVSITQRLPELTPGNYVLMTFHTATNAVEDIPFIMKDVINYFLDRGLQVLLTAPNNDKGFEQIMEIISTSLEKRGVFYIKSLGARNYYAAINECKLVCGNSSSGLIEVPYFKKPCVNIGARQEGRESDPSVYHVEADINKIREVFDTILDCPPILECHDIFGKGGSSDMILEIMLKKLANLPK